MTAGQRFLFSTCKQPGEGFCLGFQAVGAPLGIEKRSHARYRSHDGRPTVARFRAPPISLSASPRRCLGCFPTSLASAARSANSSASNCVRSASTTRISPAMRCSPAHPARCTHVSSVRRRTLRSASLLVSSSAARFRAARDIRLPPCQDARRCLSRSSWFALLCSRSASSSAARRAIAALAHRSPEAAAIDILHKLLQSGGRVRPSRVRRAVFLVLERIPRGQERCSAAAAAASAWRKLRQFRGRRSPKRRRLRPVPPYAGHIKGRQHAWRVPRGRVPRWMRSSASGTASPRPCAPARTPTDSEWLGAPGA